MCVRNGGNLVFFYLKAHFNKKNITFKTAANATIVDNAIINKIVKPLIISTTSLMCAS
ncbi:hypothetical protein CDIMF43_230002 [Carnobacterium divergens]|nr:hypothetical protein CDIMF43_230002 [Carnobacterium divergens]